MEDQTDFIVVGGGICGLACTLALAREGCSVRVLERTAELREVGAGHPDGANASRALMQLGVFDAVMEQGYCPPRLVFMHAVTGDILTTIDFGEAFVARYGGPWVTLHRNDLLQILRRRLPRPPHPHVSLHDRRGEWRTIETDGDVARARCADGTIYKAAGLLAADRVASRLLSATTATTRRWPTAMSIFAASCPGPTWWGRRPAAT